MPATDARLTVLALEPREVPAVGLLADLMPGQWGSFPRDFVGSGDKAYFVADNGHGEEVYVTDGTAAGTRIPRTVRPGSPSAVPKDLAPDGKGVLYYTADDGAGRALWKTDGTAAGTLKVPGMPAGALTGPDWADAHNGKFFFVVQLPYSTQLWATDGTATTLLATTDGYTSRPGTRDGWVYFRSHNNGGADVWRTDGTAAGTSVVPGLTVTGPGGRTGETEPEVEIAPGKWIEYVDYGYVSEVRVREGNTSLPLKSFDAIPGDWGSIHTMVYGVAQSVGGKAVFEFNPASMGGLPSAWWVTDGTVAGTKPVGNLGGAEVGDLRDKYDGRLLVSTNPTGAPYYSRLALTDTTPAGTTFLDAPDGRPSHAYYGRLPPTADAPKGLLVLATWEGQAFVTDGTPGAARWLDTTGVPTAALWELTSFRYQDLASDPPPVLGGSVFFPGPWVGNVRPEPWKWTLDIAPSAAPPAVASVVVNGGAAQRSMVTKVTVTFDKAVALAPGAFELKDKAGRLVGLNVSSQVVGGKTVVALTFTGPGVVGGSLADGVFTLTVKAARVTAAGVAMAADHSASVHRLFGDLDGDRTFDRASRWMLYERLGTTRASARYMAAFDFDSDGDIDKADEWQLLQRWGKSV